MSPCILFFLLLLLLNSVSLQFKYLFYEYTVFRRLLSTLQILLSRYRYHVIQFHIVRLITFLIVFAAKLHLKHIGSSTDSDSSPGRRRGKYSNWELPISYNKHCNERRTRRKGNLATLDRRNSRSCSEEVKLSKKDHGRRTRSESVRYDSESNGEQIKQRKSKRRLNRYKHDYDESSTESAGQNYSDHTTVRTILRKTNRRMIPEDEKTNERVKDKENASSVSNNSLEVVIVRSVEKKTEKVVSERRSKTPRKASKGETVLLKNQDNLRNKSKTESVIEESIKVVDKTCSSKLSRMNLNESKKSKRSEERLHTKSAVQDDSEEEEESIARQKTIHQRDMTDSTSQETVEYVTVTAMVHKHQTPDIPKSTSKERTLKSHQKEKKEAKNQKENLEYLKIMRPQSARLTITNKFRISSGNSKINNILERANKMHSTLMLKAVDFKKEVEEKCHVSQEFHQDELTGNIESRIKEVEKEKRDDNFVVLDKVHEFINEIISEEIINGVTTVKGRKFIKVETMDISSEDSQKECSRLSSQTEETSSLKAGKDFLNEKISMGGEINISAKFLKNSVKDEQVNSKNMENTKNSPSFESFKSENVSILPVSKKQRDKVKIQHERDSTPRTVVEDVPASDIENEPDRQDQETKSSATLIASKDTFSLNSKKSECIQKSPSKLSEAEDKIYIDEKKGKTQVKCGFHKEHTERISIMSNLKKTPTMRKATDDTSDGRTLKCIDEINRDRTSTTKEFRNERKAETLAEKTLPRSIDKFHDGSVEYRIEEITREKCEDLFQNTTEEKRIKVSSKDDEPIAICTNKYDDKEFVCKISEVADFQANKEKKLSEIEGDEEVKHLMMKESDSNISSDEDLEIRKAPILQPENFQFIDDSSTERNTLDSLTSIRLTRCLKQSTRNNNRRRRSSKSPMKKTLIESSKEYLPDQSAIVAVIDSSEWDEDEDNGINREIRKAVGEDVEHDTEPEEDNNNEVVRISSSMNEGETPRTATSVSKTTGADSLPQVHLRLQPRLPRTQSPQNNRHTESRIRHRRNSGGRDSGIEPSPRISRIPKRTTKCYLSTEKQRTLNMETVTRDVQISLRRYYLERKIFFQLMELKRLQIRHGRANEQVLIKRQVEAFHKAGATGPTLGVAKYDQPLTFRHFEAFLYEQLRQLQRRSTFPNWCTEAKQCTQKTYRCHHATSAYTSVPVYTYRRL